MLDLSRSTSGRVGTYSLLKKGPVCSESCQSSLAYALLHWIECVVAASDRTALSLSGRNVCPFSRKRDCFSVPGPAKQKKNGILAQKSRRLKSNGHCMLLCPAPFLRAFLS